MRSNNWFDVDKDGLKKLIEKRGKAFVIFELIQNAWDTRAKQVSVKIEAVPGSPTVILEVADDDPDGFFDLSHAYTLYAESVKKADPTKRGRFNLGEKLVLALCKWAEVRSTKGTVRFDSDGRTASSRTKTESGSTFKCEMAMTRAELAEAEAAMKRLIPPEGIETTYNGTVLDRPTPVATFEAILPTVITNDEGSLKETRRKTVVEVYSVEEGGTARIYEMGIPVVETGDKFRVNVRQKVPLNTDRDNVRPAYLREVRTAVLDQTHMVLTEGDAATTWTHEAMPSASASAVKSVLTKRFGEKYAAADPNDREAENRLKAAGYTIVHGGSMSGEEWARAKEVGAIQSAGQISPTTTGSVPGRTLAEHELTPGMKLTRAFIVEQMRRIIEVADITVFFTDAPAATCLAQWGDQTLTFNVAALGVHWFDDGVTEEVLDLIIHEVGHHYEGNHLSKCYNDALTKIGAKVAFAVLADPGFLARYALPATTEAVAE